MTVAAPCTCSRRTACATLPAAAASWRDVRVRAERHEGRLQPPLRQGRDVHPLLPRSRPQPTRSSELRRAVGEPDAVLRRRPFAAAAWCGRSDLIAAIATRPDPGDPTYGGDPRRVSPRGRRRPLPLISGTSSPPPLGLPVSARAWTECPAGLDHLAHVCGRVESRDHVSGSKRGRAASPRAKRQRSKRPCRGHEAIAFGRARCASGVSSQNGDRTCDAPRSAALNGHRQDDRRPPRG